MATHHADVVIVGGGTMGTAAGWAIARQGGSVTVLEQFSHVHGFGSHGGRTRIFRHAYAEGATYVPWTLEADRLWSGVQERTGTTFMHRVGCIDVSGPGHHRAREARASANAHGLAHEWLTASEVRERWPIWKIGDDREVCYGPDAGFLDVEIGLRALGRELVEAGGTIFTGAAVTGWTASADGVEATAANGDTWSGDRLIVTAGAWAGKVLAGLGIPLEVRRKPIAWFELDEATANLAEPDTMPVYISDDAHGEFYGFPHYHDAGIKIGMHSGGAVADPGTIDRTVSEVDTHTDILPFAQRSFQGITGNVLSSAVCMYTLTPDEDFIVDRHPEYERVSLAAGFSGHGFKFAPVVGTHLAALALDSSTASIPTFALSRFASS